MKKKAMKLLKFDAAKYLDHPETIAVYLSEALETGDPDYICHALDTIARAKGMTNLQYNELLAVVGLAGLTNHLVTAMQIPVDPEFSVEEQSGGKA